MKSTLFGTAYYAEYMPYDRIDTDFQLMILHIYTRFLMRPQNMISRSS